MSSLRHQGEAEAMQLAEPQETANDGAGPASDAIRASIATSLPVAWGALASQWQDAARQWSEWWTRPVQASPGGTSVHESIAASAPSRAYSMPRIDPHKAMASAEAYRRDMESLWRSALHDPESLRSRAPEHDPRFRGSDWEQPYFALLKSAYLRHAAYVQELTELTEADGATRLRLRFWVRQYLDALSPSNFLATNPEALKRALESRGSSLLQGLANLAADAQRGQIATQDASAFEVGRNLAVTPGSVVYRNELMELIQYRAATETVFARPLVVVPPCINKYYVLDLKPENSFVRFAVSQGHTVFMISWRNIPAELGRLAWDDYLEQGVMKAFDVAGSICGSADVNALGFCVGGTLLASTLAVLAARGKPPVASATFLTTLLDFEDPGEIGVYISEESIAAREKALRDGRPMEGRELAAAFASLRANDLVWSYVVNNYLKGKQPPAFDLLFWNADSTNLPGPMAAYYLRAMYLENRLREKRALTMCGAPIDLSRVDVPSYVLATKDDHIVPWQSAYRTVSLLGSKATFVLGASGHIAGVINPADKNRRNYWTNDVAPTADEWLAGAESHPGSWWLHWAEWVGARGNARQAPPSHEGSTLYPCLEPAPGRYVLEKVL